MDKNKWWIVGAVFVVAIVVAAGWILGVSPKLAEARSARADAAETEAQNAAYAERLVTLKKQFTNIADVQSDLDNVRGSVPSEADVPAFISQLNASALQNEVTLTAIGVSDALPYEPVVEEVPAEAPAEGKDASATPTPTPTASPEPAPASAAPLAETGGPTAENFIAVPFSITVGGTYARVLDFIDGLRTGERLVMVTSFETAIAPAAAPVLTAAPEAAPDGTPESVPVVAPDLVTGTITGVIYVLLNTSTDASTDAPAKKG